MNLGRGNRTNIILGLVEGVNLNVKLWNHLTETHIGQPFPSASATGAVTGVAQSV
jgi:hypothetical protein